MGVHPVRQHLHEDAFVESVALGIVVVYSQAQAQNVDRVLELLLVGRHETSSCEMSAKVFAEHLVRRALVEEACVEFEESLVETESLSCETSTKGFVEKVVKRALAEEACVEFEELPVRTESSVKAFAAQTC